MTNKEIKYGDALRETYRRPKRKLQPFPRFHNNIKEDFELFESDEDQIKAVMVDTGLSFNR